MTSPAEIEVYKAHRQGQERTAYFLLAAAGASIAYALNQTKGLPLDWPQLPAGLAVLAWAASFFFGAEYVQGTSGLLSANQELLRIQDGRHPIVGAHPNAIQQGAEIAREAIGKINDRLGRKSAWQYRLLLIGAMFYVVWHVWQMGLGPALNSKGSD